MSSRQLRALIDGLTRYRQYKATIGKPRNLEEIDRIITEMKDTVRSMEANGDVFLSRKLSLVKSN